MAPIRLFCLIVASTCLCAPFCTSLAPALPSKRMCAVRGGAAPLAAIKAPPAIYEAVAAAGQKKASNSVDDMFKLGVISGAQIGLGAFLAVRCDEQGNPKERGRGGGLY